MSHEDAPAGQEVPVFIRGRVVESTCSLASDLSFLLFRRRWDGYRPLKKPLDPSNQETIGERFQRLAAVWHEKTDYLSSMSEASSHPAYQDIIRLGPAVVPLLLRDLQDNHIHWFAALHAITGAQPIAKSWCNGWFGLKP